MITFDDAESVLRNYYLDAITNQLNGDVSPFFNAIEKTSENVDGRCVNLAIADSSGQGVVALAEDDDLPAASGNSYYSVSLPLKNLYGTIEITDKTIRASAGSPNTMINVLNAEMEGLVSRAKSNFARMLYGDGDGTICIVHSKRGSTSITVDNAKGFFVGSDISIKMENDTTLKTKVQRVIPTQEGGIGTIYITDQLGMVNVERDSPVAITGAEGKELSGLASIFDKYEVYGINKDNNPTFMPYDIEIEYDKLTEHDIMEAIDKLDEMHDSKINMILCSHNTRRKIASLTSATRAIVNSTDIAAGYSSLVINGVPVYADKYCPENRIYFVNTNDFALCQLCDWSWLEGEGGKVLKQIPGKAAYSATLVKYAELVCKKPGGQGLIRLCPAEG